MEGMTKLAQDAANATFFRAMADGGEEKRGIQENATLYIQRKLREEAYCRKILHPAQTNKTEIQRDISSDTTYAVIDIEPRSSAMEQTFRGEATGNFFESDRYIVPFFKVETEKMEKSVGELYAYQMPVIQIIQDNQVKDVEAVEDARFTNLSHDAVALTGKAIDDAGETTLTNLGVSRLFRLIDADSIPTATVLMNSETVNDILAFDALALGHTERSKVQMDGWTYEKWLGKHFITTTKTSLVQENEVWAYSKQRFIGHFLMLQGLNFWIQQLADVIEWKSWEIIGMNFGNINGCARYRFGTGVGNPTEVEPEAAVP